MNEKDVLDLEKEMKKFEKIDVTSNKKRSGNNVLIKRIYVVCLLLAFIITGLSITVSLFSASARSNLIQEIESAVVNFSLKIEKITGEEKEGLVPLKDNEVITALKGTNGQRCIDINSNNVCQIYKVSVDNASDYSTSFRSSLKLIASKNSGYTNLKWAEIMYNDTPTLLGEIKSMSDTNWKTSYGIGPNTTGEFYIAIWISDNGNNQNDTDYGNFTGNITFEAVSGDKMTSTFSSK